MNVTCPYCGRVLRTRQGYRIHLRMVHDQVESVRECTVCGKPKDAGCFGVVGSRIGHQGQNIPRYRSECDDCRSKEHEELNRKRAARPESHKRRDRKKARAATYGLSVEAYDKLWKKRLDVQSGLCAVCSKQAPECLDHHHSSGQLRGTLCRSCNSAVGFLQDDPKVVRAMATYLEHYEALRDDSLKKEGK